MKKLISAALLLNLIGIFMLVGCGSNKAASSNDAIEFAKTIQSLQEKTNYLLNQAKAFYNAKDFKQAITLAQYVLSYVDQNSAQAKDLLEKAKSGLASFAQKKADTLKSNILGK